MELHAGCRVIVAVLHSTNHNYESWIWQLWEVTSRFFASVLCKIRHWSLVALPHLLPRLLNLLPHFFRNISTHCRRKHWALSKFSKGSQVSTVSKKSATSASQCRGPSLSRFKWFSPAIMGRCSFSRNPATHNFFHWLNKLKLGCPILLANCLKENSVRFMLIGALPSAPPKSDESSLS